MKSRGFTVSIVTALITATLATSGAFAQEKTVDQKLQDLQDQINALQRQRQLEAEGVITNQAQPAPVAVKDAGYVTAGADGFALNSADGNFRLRVGGYLQADARFYLNDTPNKTIDTFVMRRVRPIFEGTVYHDFDFRIMPDFGNGAAQTTLLQDAYVEWHTFPWLKLRAGKFKPPVGLEQLQQDTWLDFAERGLPSDLIPQRDVGAQVSGDLFGGVVTYAGGVFNGVVDGGIADLDNWDSKDAAARLFIQPFRTTDIAPLKGFGFGAGGTIGTERYSSTVTNLPTYKSTGQSTIFSFRNGVAQKGDSLRVTPQSYYYWGPYSAFAEYAVSDQEYSDGAAHADLKNSAWQVQATYVLTGENATYAGVSPRHPFNPKQGKWGAFELVARYGDLHFDPHAFTAFADPTKSVQEDHEWGVGLNWYLNKNVKLVLNYEENIFDNGAGTVGHLRNRPTEEALITRAQIQF